MNSIEFGKKCKPYNIQYRDIFGYVPCRDDYTCRQDEYFDALLNLPSRPAGSFPSC